MQRGPASVVCYICDVTLDPSQTDRLERAGVILPRDVRCRRSGHGAHVSPVERLQLRERRSVEPPELAAEE